MAAHRPGLRGVITDWGGVLTNPIGQTVNAWLDAEQIDQDSYLAVMRRWVVQAYGSHGRGGPVSGENPVHALERGECTDEEFERQLAGQLARLDGMPVPAEGLLARMFAATVVEEGMHELMRSLRRAGIRTALLSNSWGSGFYPRETFPEMFDAVVISAEVGMRKPEERIFQLAAQRLDLRPDECVFIDDIEANVLAARALGLAGIHHSERDLTTRQLSELLGVTL